MGTDITLDNMLTILDELYNNVKALDALNQELFQLQMADKETVSDWAVCLSRHLQVLAASFPECFSPTCVAKLKCDCFYSGLPKHLKAIMAYLKASPEEKSYSDYLQAAREAEKEDSMELSQSPQCLAADNTAKPRVTSSFLLQKLKGTQPALKTPEVHLAHLEEESAKKDKEVESEDPDVLNGVTEEFMVHLARAIKDGQVEEEHCYHCSSLEHFIHDCPLVKACGSKYTFELQRGDGTREGSLGPSDESDYAQNPPGGGPQGIGWCTQTPFLNPEPFQHWYGVENVAKVKINGESCMTLLNNGVQINTITPSYVKSHSLEMGLITDLIGRRVAWVGLGNAYTWPLGYVIVKVQVDGVQGYNKDQIALVVLHLSNFVERIPIILGNPTISQILNVMKEEREIDALTMPWANAREAHLLSVQRAAATMVDDQNMGESGLDKYDEVAITNNMETVDAFSSCVIPMRAKKAYMEECINVMTLALQTKDGFLLQGLTVQNAYTELRKGSKNAVMMVRNSMAYP